MVLIAPQSGTEHLLEARALRLGVPIEYGTNVVGLRQDAEGVVLDVEKDGVTGQRTAGYVVGCDGSHSAVRGLVGVDFVGKQYETHILLADVRLTDPPAEAMFTRNNNDGVVLCVPFGDSWYRVLAWDRLREQAPLTEPVTAAEMRDAFRRIAGTDFGMGEPRWSSRFLSERRQARHYRVGRVFLAGDAAHVHSPMGGQGMNTGIQDAMNLGWKLAGAVHGWAPRLLLDSYEGERHPVGATVLQMTDAFNRMMVGHSRPLRLLQRLVISSVLRLRRPRLAVGGRLTGLGIAYPSREPGRHPWAGRRMPDVRCTGGPPVRTAARRSIRAGQDYEHGRGRADGRSVVRSCPVGLPRAGQRRGAPDDRPRAARRLRRLGRGQPDAGGRRGGGVALVRTCHVRPAAMTQHCRIVVAGPLLTAGRHSRSIHRDHDHQRRLHHRGRALRRRGRRSDRADPAVGPRARRPVAHPRRLKRQIRPMPRATATASCREATPSLR